MPELEVTGVRSPGPRVDIGHNRERARGLTVSFADVEDMYIEKFNPENVRNEDQYKGKWEQATILREEIRGQG